MKPKDLIVAETVGEDLVDCPTAPGMKELTQHLRPKSISETKTDPAATQKVV